MRQSPSIQQFLLINNNKIMLELETKLLYKRQSFSQSKHLNPSKNKIKKNKAKKYSKNQSHHQKHNQDETISRITALKNRHRGNLSNTIVEHFGQQPFSQNQRQNKSLVNEGKNQKEVSPILIQCQNESISKVQYLDRVRQNQKLSQQLDQKNKQIRFLNKKYAQLHQKYLSLLEKNTLNKCPSTPLPDFQDISRISQKFSQQSLKRKQQLESIKNRLNRLNFSKIQKILDDSSLKISRY